MKKRRRKPRNVGPVRKDHKVAESGTWLYAERIRAQLTIDQLAEKANVSRRTIIRIEQGDNRRLHWLTKRNLRNALGMLDGI